MVISSDLFIRLKITVQTNLKCVDYLDVTLNLNTGTYQPYRKPNDNPLYVNRLSNHPPAIIKQIPIAVESRISSLSSNEDAFRNAAPPYDEALKNSGYNHNIKYRETEQEKEKNEKKKKKNRGRNITWFNPPFSGNVQTNVGRKFLLLVSKHFPAGHKLHQIFNKNTIKVSYSCMKNINTVIKNHNDRIIRRFKGSTETEKESRCNCRQKGECPLQGSCLEKAIVYRATVTSPDGRKEYYGSTGEHSRTGTPTTKSQPSMKNTKTKQNSQNIYGN